MIQLTFFMLIHKKKKTKHEIERLCLRNIYHLHTKHF